MKDTDSKQKTVSSAGRSFDDFGKEGLIPESQNSSPSWSAPAPKWLKERLAPGISDESAKSGESGSIQSAVPQQPAAPQQPAIAHQPKRHWEKHKKQAKFSEGKERERDDISCRSSGFVAGEETYSIQFHIKDNNGKDTKDANGNIIRKSIDCAGMYYSVYIKDDDDYQAKLVTDKQGLTCVISSNKRSIVYLYIGHRSEPKEKLPGVNDAPALISYEAPLIAVMMSKTYELIEVHTKRLWKP